MKKRKLLVIFLFCLLALPFPFSLISWIGRSHLETTYQSDMPMLTISEYDIYVDTRTATSAELARSGVSYEAVAAIKSNDIEDELTRLSALPDEELSNRGYNTGQIEILHDYTGERIETNPKLRGIFADVKCNFYQYTANNISLSLKIVWEWTNKPMLSGISITDIVVIRWQGTNTAGLPMNLALNSSGSSCMINYYNPYESYQSQSSVSISTTDPYGHAYAKFPMSNGIANGSSYAKTGTLITKIDRTGTDAIKEAAFVFAYGHTTVALTNPSLSLPDPFGIYFSFGVTTMCKEVIRMNSSGIITRY
ncbi:hypothetical protein [Lachnoclostridium phytofermentans]|uniref:Uncharacterized protein n=1 Tax=Lachnoclostridium phytofermentans (strain ATCC 700394 / DSM 18823 / ISDg) TaxID=357809 RepID=A9KNJ8_LACP7|nr:hypothetical protein [Lachnoclostridium phytofermentans]ABX43115.1 hypothetical protein Cphy_2755 [Lachnoclostridium phytofermentans ISDg]